MSRCILLMMLLGAIALCLVHADEELSKEHAKEVAHECKEESGASDEDVEHLLKHEVADSHESKCLRACVMKKFGIMDESGKFSKDHAVALIKAMSKQDAEKEAAGLAVIEKCEDVDAPEDHCDAAAVYESCIHEHIQEHAISLEES